MNEINRAWEQYKAKVIPNNAPYIQKVECKRAFFRGAGAVLDLLTAMDNNRATEGEKGQAIDAAMREVVDFRKQVASDLA